jgi:hypothetical protein
MDRDSAVVTNKWFKRRWVRIAITTIAFSSLCYCGLMGYKLYRWHRERQVFDDLRTLTTTLGNQAAKLKTLHGEFDTQGASDLSADLRTRTRRAVFETVRLLIESESKLKAVRSRTEDLPEDRIESSRTVAAAAQHWLEPGGLLLSCKQLDRDLSKHGR